MAGRNIRPLKTEESLFSVMAVKIFIPQWREKVLDLMRRMRLLK